MKLIYLTLANFYSSQKFKVKVFLSFLNSVDGSWGCVNADFFPPSPLLHIWISIVFLLSGMCLCLFLCHVPPLWKFHQALPVMNCVCASHAFLQSNDNPCNVTPGIFLQLPSTYICSETLSDEQVCNSTDGMQLFNLKVPPSRSQTSTGMSAGMCFIQIHCYLHSLVSLLITRFTSFGQQPSLLVYWSLNPILQSC